MLIEGLAAAAGLVGGFTLGARARQDVHEHEPSARDALPLPPSFVGGGDGSSETLAGPAAFADEGRIQKSMTLMLVGDSLAGKSLFCTRITLRGSELGRETLPKTTAPMWHRIELRLPGNTQSRDGQRGARVSFQLLDTPGRPELAELLVPFYRQVHAHVFMFDVGSATSFSRMKDFVRIAREHLHAAGSTRKGAAAVVPVVLAHVIDERRERQVTRRDASSWCALEGLTYFETHPKDDVGWRRMMAHLARAGFADADKQQQQPSPQLQRRGGTAPPSYVPA